MSRGVKEKISINREDFLNLIKQDDETVNLYREKYIGKCEYCGKEFFREKKNQICCNQRCSTLKSHAKNPERVREIKREWARRNRAKKQEASL